MSIPVTFENFVRVESEIMFSRLAAKTGTGVWTHYRALSPLDQQPIVRQNRDTLYSSAIVDIRHGATLTLPDAGERYLSVMLVTQDHHIPVIFHEAGEYRLTAEEYGSDFVLLAARILIDPNDPADAPVVNALQDALGLDAPTGTFAAPDVEEASYRETRDALGVLSKGLTDYRGAFGKAEDVDPIRHLLGSMSAWGGLPEEEANYINVNPGLPVAEYRMRLVDVPVDAFWSVSLYNADGYFEANATDVHSINSLTATRDADGAVTIRFGTQPEGENYLPIMEGWNFLLRMYRPRPEALDGTWPTPAIEAL